MEFGRNKNISIWNRWSYRETIWNNFTEKDIKAGIPKIEIDTALKEGRSVDVRWHLCKDGNKFYAYGLVFPLKSIEEEVIGYVKILLDVTERKKSEDSINKYTKELEELNIHKDSVLAILFHDLRSPLAGIIQGTKYPKLNFDKIEPTFEKELGVHLNVRLTSYANHLISWQTIAYEENSLKKACF